MLLSCLQMTLVKYTNECQNTLTSEDGLNETQIVYGSSLFPMQRWNHHQAGADRIARTTSSIEGWHCGLQSLFQCHHPTLWTFVDGSDQSRNTKESLACVRVLHLRVHVAHSLLNLYITNH